MVVRSVAGVKVTAVEIVSSRNGVVWLILVIPMFDVVLAVVVLVVAGLDANDRSSLVVIAVVLVADISLPESPLLLIGWFWFPMPPRLGGLGWS